MVWKVSRLGDHARIIQDGTVQGRFDSGPDKMEGRFTGVHGTWRLAFLTETGVDFQVDDGTKRGLARMSLSVSHEGLMWLPEKGKLAVQPDGQVGGVVGTADGGGQPILRWTVVGHRPAPRALHLAFVDHDWEERERLALALLVLCVDRWIRGHG